jgi:hypothetical protein
MKGVVSLGKQASYGVKMMGGGESFASSPYTPEYKTQITLKEFAEKGEIVLNDLNSLIELENNSELRRGFKKHKHLESVLFKVIDYRTHILKKGFFCAEVENFLYPPKAPRKPAGYKEMKSSI